jgi:hypothetical protein
MDPEVGIAAAHRQPVAGPQPRQGPFDEDVGAAIEAQVLKVDSRAQR